MKNAFIVAAIACLPFRAALADNPSGVDEILRAPQPLWKVAPTGVIAELVRAPGGKIEPRQIQALLDGHLAAALKIDSPERAVADGVLQIGKDGQSLAFESRPSVAGVLMGRERQRMSDAALQSAAESFVRRRLLTDEAFKRVAQIGPREALVLRDAYSRVSTVSNGKETTSSLMSRAFVFERRYDGIPFVGPGNKAVVRLSPTGQVIGLQIMLPRLVPTGKSLRVIDGRRLSAGLAELGATVPGKPGRDLAQMRCGYFDDEEAHTVASRPLSAVCAVDMRESATFDRRRMVVGVSE
jgi:hypothetical protein